MLSGTHCSKGIFWHLQQYSTMDIIIKISKSLLAFCFTVQAAPWTFQRIFRWSNELNCLFNQYNEVGNKEESFNNAPTDLSSFNSSILHQRINSSNQWSIHYKKELNSNWTRKREWARTYTAHMQILHYQLPLPPTQHRSNSSPEIQYLFTLWVIINWTASRIEEEEMNWSHIKINYWS